MSFEKVLIALHKPISHTDHFKWMKSDSFRLLENFMKNSRVTSLSWIYDYRASNVYRYRRFLVIIMRRLAHNQSTYPKCTLNLSLSTYHPTYILKQSACQSHKMSNKLRNFLLNSLSVTPLSGSILSHSLNQ